MNSYFPAESVKLIFSGNDFFEKLEDSIDKAKEIIHFQTYIFEEDETGKQIADALIRASKRGVEIYLLVDAYGSKDLSIQFIKKIQEAGIQFRFFSPLFSKESIYLGRRLHHKVVVIDRNIAIIGGINIGDRYRGSDSNPAWLDYAALVTGDVCLELHDLCLALFEKRRFRQPEKTFIKENETETPLVRFSKNDWIRGRNEIHKRAIYSFKNAQKTIIIISSYFLPGYSYRRALKNARRRGVTVKVILAGQSDMRFLLYAEKHLYRFLCKHGIEICEWSDSVLHGKAIMVDHEWVSIGSYNLNYLSRYWSIELNAEVKDTVFINEFSTHLDLIASSRCVFIDENKMRSSSFFVTIRNAFAYYIYRIMMKVFFSKKHKH
ncbi:MAG TPA: phospholipase D-like domain-containing protein [Bacteroidia bacterium]|nr:phospholipase D-like domain-containing protein [Bacteroidia bacterium]